MKIDILTLSLVSFGLVAFTWLTSRWWYLRKLRAAQHRMLSLDGAHQSALKLMAQARKQIEDLQRIVTEYRRRLTTAELSVRRSPGQVEPVSVVEADEGAEDAEAPSKTPVVWADTQPL
jgi:hypothetical protein